MAYNITYIDYPYSWPYSWPYSRRGAWGRPPRGLGPPAEGPGPPAEGPGAARRGAWGRPPRGLGPPEHEITRQSPNRLYKAPTDNTKPRHIRQNPDRQYKAPVSNDLQRYSQYYLTGLVWGAAPAWYGGSPRPGIGGRLLGGRNRARNRAN